MPSPFPTLIVDLDIVRANIQAMSDKATRNSVEFRPHFKTHQSRHIGRIFKDFDVKGITVSSLKMANYFAEDGWNDITIAFPANIAAAALYNDLAAEVELKTLISSVKAAKFLDAKLTHELGLYIDIDAQYGRSGVPVRNTATISELIEVIRNSKYCYLAGFYCHAGHTYNARSKKEVLEISTGVLDQLNSLKQEYQTVPICFGDTPSCSVLDEFGPADQISPGNFVFYDWMQVEIGSCTPDQIAVVMKCPVIEKFDDRKHILIHGGAVHFSKESIQLDAQDSYGQVITPAISADNYIYKISQEHGIINCNATTYKSYDIAESIDVYPIHSCLTADLMREYQTKDGKIIDHMNG